MEAQLQFTDLLDTFFNGLQALAAVLVIYYGKGYLKEHKEKVKIDRQMVLKEKAVKMLYKTYMYFVTMFSAKSVPQLYISIESEADRIMTKFNSKNAENKKELMSLIGFVAQQDFNGNTLFYQLGMLGSYLTLLDEKHFEDSFQSFQKKVTDTMRAAAVIYEQISSKDKGTEADLTELLKEYQLHSAIHRTNMTHPLSVKFYAFADLIRDYSG